MIPAQLESETIVLADEVRIGALIELELNGVDGGEAEVCVSLHFRVR
jgi:hypothetical protein